MKRIKKAIENMFREMKITQTISPFLLTGCLILGGCSFQGTSPAQDAAGRGSQTMEAEAGRDDHGEDSISVGSGQAKAPEPSGYETRELSAGRGGNQIYGVAYVPAGVEGPMPAVIYAHGYGATHQNGVQYAEKLAEQGYVVYCFDFCGGSTSSRSDGTPMEMSIFTEQADLEAVIGMVRGLEYVDSQNVFLFGASQGDLWRELQQRPM